MVPHATTEFERPRSSSSAHPTPKTSKFPDFDVDERDDDTFEDISRGPRPKPLPNGLPPGLHSSERWPLRKEAKGTSWGAWANGAAGGTRHSRQKSLSEAIRTVRGRKASISENAHEIAESLKAPVSYKLVVCSAGFNIWACTSNDARFCAVSGSLHRSSAILRRRRS